MLAHTWIELGQNLIPRHQSTKVLVLTRPRQCPGCTLLPQQPVLSFIASALVCVMLRAQRVPDLNEVSLYWSCERCFPVALNGSVVTMTFICDLWLALLHHRLGCRDQVVNLNIDALGGLGCQCLRRASQQ